MSEGICILVQYIVVDTWFLLIIFNPLNDKLNPICHLRALLGAHILNVSRVRVKEEWLMFFFGSKTPITCNCMSKFLRGSEVFQVMCIGKMCCVTDQLQCFVTAITLKYQKKMCTAGVLLCFILQIYYFSKGEHVSLIYCHTSNQYLKISVELRHKFGLFYNFNVDCM